MHICHEFYQYFCKKYSYGKDIDGGFCIIVKLFTKNVDFTCKYEVFGVKY